MKILIVEDEVLILEKLREYVSLLGHQLTSTSSSYNDAVLSIASEKPDCALLDIDLNEKKSGIDLAQYLASVQIPFIFLSAKQDMYTYQQAKLTKPIGNLEKPVSLNTLRNMLDTVQNIENKGELDFLFIGSKKEKIRIWVKDIVYLKADSNYCNIFVKNKTEGLDKHLESRSMGELLRTINSQKLIQVHRSFSVHVDSIEGKIGNELRVVGNENIPTSESYRNRINDILNL